MSLKVGCPGCYRCGHAGPLPDEGPVCDGSGYVPSNPGELKMSDPQYLIPVVFEKKERVTTSHEIKISLGELIKAVVYSMPDKYKFLLEHDQPTINYSFDESIGLIISWRTVDHDD